MTAIRLEKIVREAIANRDGDRIQKIVDQLCHDYAYAVYQPHARNGGLIGLAAASIALGSVSRLDVLIRIARIRAEIRIYRRKLLHTFRKSCRRF